MVCWPRGPSWSREARERLPDQAKALLAEAERIGRQSGEWARDPEGDGVALALASRAAELRRQAQALCPHEVVDETRCAPVTIYAEVEPGRFAEVERVTVTRSCPVCGWSEKKVQERVMRDITRDEYLDWLMRR